MGRRSYTSLEEMQELCRIARQKARERQKVRNERIKATTNLPYCFSYKMRNAFFGKPCPVCGRRMGVPVRNDDDPIVSCTPFPTIQHNIPISKGGTNTIDNISVICRSCNSQIKDNITGGLNNEEVRKVWAEINGNKEGCRYGLLDR